MKGLRGFFTAAVLVGVFGIGLGAAAKENYTGRTLKSGTAGCGGCHASVSTAVAVVIAGPDTLRPGASGTYTVKISGGSGTSVCVDIATSAGALKTFDANLKLSNGELITNGIKRYTNGSYTYTFTLTAPATPQTVTLYATGMSTKSTFNFAPNKAVVIGSPATSTGTPDAVPEHAPLLVNYPEPFHAATTLAFALPAAGFARLALYDAGGREVAVLSEGSHTAGHHTLSWNAGGLQPGVYFLRLSARLNDGRVVQTTRKMTVLR